MLEEIKDMPKVLDQVNDLATKIDEATNAIAARIQMFIHMIDA
jgi:hypothetical protein